MKFAIIALLANTSAIQLRGYPGPGAFAGQHDCENGTVQRHCPPGKPCYIASSSHGATCTDGSGDSVALVQLAGEPGSCENGNVQRNYKAGEGTDKQGTGNGSGSISREDTGATCVNEIGDKALVQVKTEPFYKPFPNENCPDGDGSRSFTPGAGTDGAAKGKESGSISRADSSTPTCINESGDASLVQL